MSKQNLEQFYIFVQNNEQLQQQLGSSENKDNFSEMAVRIGQENGYSFTADEVEALINQRRQESESELNDAELEAVAGGQASGFTVCVATKKCWGSIC
ncbi:Nif11-like leader peptide family RiPP precursor [aff. Roholtiella sp. LEGE 12411]|uniref:Nif11-like leader peptide family RiPP precursor n=1 Tax=aff. Roholtiella sp. LEGE 12411 TaxID=1828822 RepID=UPI00187EFC89|nr:Nif11-like leader peptide family RiPP precursor [aff. Roholtiella sp. LEGE 12411]MBE9035707.1 Nif11-like leader peptide family RiPP precursor [aff. Roholtiella sp. LEGE 12411]